jgi:hypothetical protein
MPDRVNLSGIFVWKNRNQLLAEDSNPVVLGSIPVEAYFMRHILIIITLLTGAQQNQRNFPCGLFLIPGVRWRGGDHVLPGLGAGFAGELLGSDG